MRDFNLPTPLSYWQTGHDTVPAASKARVQLLTEWENLLYGDFRFIGLSDFERTVIVNYFKRSVLFCVDLLMAYPPTIEGLGDDFNMDDIMVGIRDALIDYFSLGTGVLYGYDGKITHVQPMNWFPDREGVGDAITASSAIVNEDGAVDSQRLLTVMKLAEGDSAQLTFKTTGNRIETLVSETPIEWPGVRPIVPCPRPPTQHEWGSSLIQEMIDEVREVTKRYSLNSSILDDHAAPLLLFRNSPDMKPTSVRGYRDTDAEAERKIEISQVSLRGLRKKPTAILPDSIDEAEYMVWDGSLGASFEQIDIIEQALYATTRVPASLQGVLKDGGPPSGTSLKRQYASAYVMLEQVQHSFIPKIALALEAAGLSYTSIEWLNVLDQLDTAIIQQEQQSERDTEIEEGGNLA